MSGDLYALMRAEQLERERRERASRDPERERMNRPADWIVPVVQGLWPWLLGGAAPWWFTTGPGIRAGRGRQLW